MLRFVLGTACLMVMAVATNAENSKGWRDCVSSDPERSIAACSEVIEAGPNSGVDLSVAFFNRGNAHLRERAFDRAIADYDQTIKLNPKHAMAYFYRGNANSVIGRFDRAIADYDKAIELNPEFPAAYAMRGKAYRGKRDRDRALQDFNAAIGINPNYAAAYMNRGISYGEQGKFRIQLEATPTV